MLLPSGMMNSCPERASSTTKPPFLSASCLGVKYSTWICARGQSAVAASNALSIGVGPQHWTSAFVGRLRELGWIDGRNIAIEYRWAEGRSERFAKIASEFVQSNVSVIVTAGAAVLAAKQATSKIPIVFAVASDPLGSGLVASLARPGGNVTGLSVQALDLAGKRLEILREIIPGLHTLAVIANADYPAAVLEMDEVQSAARQLGLEILRAEIRRTEDIAPAFETLQGRAQGLYVCIDFLTDTNRLRINTLALGARLPAMSGFRENVEAGGLIFHRANVPDLFRRAAELVDKILRGLHFRRAPRAREERVSPGGGLAAVA
jgi:ABC-type uncharacterized transport system substrate-binding protein